LQQPGHILSGTLDLADDAGIVVSIVEQDGDVAWIVAETVVGRVEIIASMVREGDTLLLRGLHVDGPGAGSMGVAMVRRIARELGKQQHVRQILVFGGVRTTGATPVIDRGQS